MRIGFVGLVHSHPFTDARMAREECDAELVVHSDQPDRLAAFLTERDGECAIASSLAELIAARPDVVIVTQRPPEVAGTVGAVLDAGIPCFANKVVAANSAQLAALDAAVGARADRFGTASVLRFAPATRRLAERIDGTDVRLLRAVARHDISGYREPHRQWNDSPEIGGGTMVSIGLHGIELVDAVSGWHEAPLTVAAERTNGPAARTESEEAAMVLLRATQGPLATVEVSGVAAEEQYLVAAHTNDRVIEETLDGPDPMAALGYRNTMRAILAMAAGAPFPVSWSRSRGVLRAVLDAASLARR